MHARLVMRLALALVLSLTGCMLVFDDGDSRRDDGSGSASPDGCYIGGCSSQLCTDRPDVASTCEWLDKYACYRRATCERQATGACDWTATPELAACLADPPPLP